MERMSVREWMSEQEAAAEINKSVRTLREWRKRRQGPPYAFFGRTVRYHRPTFHEHFQANQIMPLRKSRRSA
jgi:hypothetical protein